MVAIAVTHEHYEDAEYEANARLIAAAPELLAAVAAITAVLGDAFVDEECDAETQLGGYIFGDVMQDAFRDARAAIAKVTGQ